MELLNKLNDEYKLIQASEVYSFDNKETEKKETTWIFYNNAFNQIAQFEDDVIPVPIFSLYRSRLADIIQPDHINLVNYKSIYDITSEVEKLDIPAGAHMKDVWSDVLEKKGYKSLMMDKSEIKGDFTVACDFATFALLIAEYRTKPIVVKKDGDYRVLGVIVYEVDDGVIEVESADKRKAKTELIKQIKSDLVKHQVVDMGGKLPTSDKKLELMVK